MVSVCFRGVWFRHHMEGFEVNTPAPYEDRDVESSHAGVDVSGFRVQGLCFRVQGLGFMVPILVFRFEGLRLRVSVVGIRVHGLGFSIQELSFRD